MTTAMRDAVSPDLRATLRALKLGQMLHTLPDRLTLARQQNMTHADFLELVLADEHARREAKSASLRARAAGLEAGMRLDTWDTAAAVRYDQQLWNELASLRFLDAHHGALLLGPVGVGKTHLACALGHIAIRRRRGVHMARAGKLFKRLKAARLDNTLDYEMRRLATTELLTYEPPAAVVAPEDRERVEHVAQDPGVGQHEYPSPVTELDAVERQVVLDVALDRQARVAEVVSAAEARERPQVPGLAGEPVQVDQPLVDPVPEGMPHRPGAPVRDLAGDQGWQLGQLRAGGRRRRREERGRAHQATPKCRAASTPERQPSSWKPQPW